MLRSWEHGWVFGYGHKRDQGDPPVSTAIYFRSLAAVAAHRLAIAVIILLRKNFIAWHMNSK